MPKHKAITMPKTLFASLFRMQAMQAQCFTIILTIQRPYLTYTGAYYLFCYKLCRIERHLYCFATKQGKRQRLYLTYPYYGTITRIVCHGQGTCYIDRTRINSPKRRISHWLCVPFPGPKWSRRAILTVIGHIGHGEARSTVLSPFLAF